MSMKQGLASCFGMNQTFAYASLQNQHLWAKFRTNYINIKLNLVLFGLIAEEDFLHKNQRIIVFLTGINNER